MPAVGGHSGIGDISPGSARCRNPSRTTIAHLRAPPALQQTGRGARLGDLDGLIDLLRADVVQRRLFLVELEDQPRLVRLDKESTSTTPGLSSKRLWIFSAMRICSP